MLEKQAAQKIAALGYVLGYLEKTAKDEEQPWYNRALAGAQDWWKSSDAKKYWDDLGEKGQRDLMLTAGATAAGGLGGGYLGGWKGAGLGALAGGAGMYGGLKGYDYLTTPDEVGRTPWARLKNYATGQKPIDLNASIPGNEAIRNVSPVYDDLMKKFEDYGMTKAEAQDYIQKLSQGLL